MSVEDEERVRRETMALAVEGTLDQFRTKPTNSGENLRIEVTRQKPNEGTDPTQYLEFRVCKSPNNNNVLGEWLRIHQIAKQSPGWNEIHKSREASILVADAWDEATSYARQCQVSLIWLDDPDNLFQPVLEQ